jgi:hypothetical protein
MRVSKVIPTTRTSFMRRASASAFPIGRNSVVALGEYCGNTIHPAGYVRFKL